MYFIYMAFPKGRKNPNAGRPKGSVDKKILRGRHAIAEFVEGNAHRLVGWLDAMAETDPEAAFKAYMSVVQYHIPALQRQEITGKDGERLQINVVTGLNLPVIEGEFKSVERDPLENTSLQSGISLLPKPETGGSE